MKKNSRNHSQLSRERRRELRSNMSVSEQVLWQTLRCDVMGFRFRRQVSVGDYYLDFCCAAAGLCIEVDGEQHDKRLIRDAKRDTFLAGRGIYTMRIPSLDLFDLDSPKFEVWL